MRVPAMNTSGTLEEIAVENSIQECGGSILLAASFPISYLASIYIFDYGGIDRNSAKSIKRRTLGVTCCCLANIVLTQHWLQDAPFLPLRITDLSSAAAALLLTFILFLGPVAQETAVGEFQAYFGRDFWRRELGKWPNIRNWLISPISEEVLFRGCSCTVLAQCLPAARVVFFSPLFFSLAHLHHIRELGRCGNTWTAAVALSGFQALYTYIFGVYASFLYLRSGTILAPVVAHMFCNFMGFPPIHEVFELRPRIRCFIVVTLYLCGIFTWQSLLFRLV